MHKLNTILFLILAINFVSCDNQESEFDNINLDSDWKLNDVFSQKEKSLFDTLNFSRTANYTPIESEPTPISPTIWFYPNPFKGDGSLSFTHAPIINIAIVNHLYKKVVEARFENTNSIAFNLSDKPSGIYKLYYVIQDSNFNIVYLGHGNIKKE